jgi:hypothetical protein
VSEREGPQGERASTVSEREGPQGERASTVSEREGPQGERASTVSEREGGDAAGGGYGEPGSIGEEAARLADAVHGWARTTFPGLSEHIATGAPECRYCPLCRLVAVLRGNRPEVTERVAEAASAVADAVRTVADALARPAGSAWSAATDRTVGPNARPDGHRVEPIDLS